MNKDLIILKTKKGTVKEMKDHTEWFREKHGAEGVRIYHDSVIDNACCSRHAGSMSNVLAIYRVSGGKIIETLVADGVDIRHMLIESKRDAD